MVSHLPNILIFLTRGSISFFEPKSGYAKTLTVPETLVKDLEVIDPGGLATWISTFLEKENLGLGECLVVISEAISFIRDIPLSEENKKGVLVQDFTDAVPLESPEVKVFRFGQVEKIVAVNSKYYQVLTETLVARGFTIAGITPGAILPEVGATASISLDIAKKILEDFEKIKFQSFIEAPSPNLQVARPIITTEKPKGSRIYVLVAVFIVGTIILLTLIFLKR